MKRIVLFFYFFFGYLVIQAQSFSVEQKINDLIKKMTLEEKIGMLHGNTAFSTAGVKRLGIPELVMSDGPHGVNYERPLDWSTPRPASLDSGTYLPVGVCLAATWNTKLGYDFGKVLGKEAAFRKKDIILGPGINIIRNPLNGRNFEYQSEDPYLISKMVVGYIKGVQEQGVAACVKHFIANNQEINRNTINVEMSERALQEIYLPGFKAAVMAGVSTIMGAYNQFRGEYCTHNNYLVNKILKGDWNFKGIMISDWGAVHNTMQALTNGCDIEMGSELAMLPNINYNKFFLGDSALALIKSGQVDESVIDEKVRRILRIMYKYNMIGGTKQSGQYNTKDHQLTALKVAEEGIVLLKNENNLLPLNKSKIKSIAVIGNNAVRLHGFGGGSSQVKAYYEISPLKGILNIVGQNVKVDFSKGYDDYKDSKANDSLINAAISVAKNADVVIFVGGWTHGYDYNKWDDNAFDAENVDKPNLQMPFDQDILIKALQKVNPNLVVVLVGGGPVDMTAWEGKTRSIIQAWYAGMEGGTALANILFGKVNPSGKLPFTFPKKLEDAPAIKIGEYPGDGSTVRYKEDIFVGYRYYDSYNIIPQFAFGHGLSYTTFKYSNLKIATSKHSATISFVLKNTGEKEGAEVAQVYVSEVNPIVPRPKKELKAFQKIFLKAGEEKLVTLKLDETSFQYFDDTKMKWVVNPGVFNILIGSSSTDVRLNRMISIK